MSSAETQAALSRAFELVEAGKNEEARAILDPILAANPNNADAWWVYAHAADDPAEGQAALKKVLSINPDYPGAAELLAMAQEQFPEEEEAAAPPPQVPPSLPEADFAEPDFDTEELSPAPSETGRRRSFLMPLIAVVIIVVLIALVLVSQLGRNTSPPATQTPTELVSVIVAPTEAAAQAATEPITMPTAVMTQAVTLAPSAATEQIPATGEATAETAGGQYAALQQALAQFSLVQNGIQETQTSFGQTLQVTGCSTAGRAIRLLLPNLMNAFAMQSQTLDRSVKAISVHLINCDSNSPLVTVAVGRESAQAYAAGTLTDAEFAARWKSQ